MASDITHLVVGQTYSEEAIEELFGLEPGTLADPDNRIIPCNITPDAD